MASSDESRRLWATSRAVLQSRWFPAIVACLAMILALPSLRTGWILDDWYHRAVLLEQSQFRDLLGGPSEMFRFFRGDPERTGRLIDVGFFPWWTDPTLKAEFLQATTVLTHRLDYALWPNSPVLMHAHSILWLGAAVLAVAIFYRRMLGPTWIAGLAALAFAVDDARGATVGFIANRNVLVAATFGVWSLICHDRWRREGSWRSAVIAPFLLLTALFSKEEGVGTCAYLGAYALLADPRDWRRGLLALWPYAIAFVTWAFLRASWGYGVRDVSLYIDPITDTSRYIVAAAQRLPILLFGQWGPIPSDLGIVLGRVANLWFLGIVIASLGILFAMLFALFRRDSLARFWAMGMILGAVPVSATIPGDRLLTFAGIGASALLAQFLAYAFAGIGNRLLRMLSKVFAGFLVIVHLIVAPIATMIRAEHPIGPRWVEHRLHITLPLDGIENRTLVVVNAPSTMIANYVLLRREMNGLPLPHNLRVLAPAIVSVTIRRVDDHTLAILPEGGYLRFPLDAIFRSERKPFAVGDQVKLTGMTATIISLTDDHRPDEVQFRFDVPLESPSLYWLCYRDGGFEPFIPPEMGEEVEIRINWRALLAPP